jgi:alginate O-acetyltransferase complex protein AlgJ
VTDATPEPLAPETPGAPGTAGQAPPRLRYAFAALALAFLMLPPLIAIAGISGSPLERERTAKAPRLADGWDAFAQLADYATQHLPFRAEGVDANTWIANNIWGRSPEYGRSSPAKALPFEGVQAQAQAGGGYNQTGGAAKTNPVVSTGPNGWLFLQGELDTLCHPPVGFKTALARWTELIKAVRASGRKVVLLVAPEKSTVYPEQVSPNAIAWRCARRNKMRFWAELQSQHDPDIVPLLQPLLALKRRDPGHLVYLRYNSHWNSAGAILLPEKALERLGGPVQVRPRDVHRGVRRYHTDLGVLIGHPDVSERAQFRQIERPGDASLRSTNIPGATVFTHPGDARTVLQGRTLFLHDSFGGQAVPMFPHYAAEVAIAWWIQDTPEDVLRLMRSSNTVIIETVEREFLNRAAAGKEGAVVTPDFLRSLPQKLGPPPR